MIRDTPRWLDGTDDSSDMGEEALGDMGGVAERTFSVLDDIDGVAERTFWVTWVV